MTTIATLVNHQVKEVETSELSDEMLAYLYWNSKDSLVIANTAIHTAPSDRSKANAIKNLENNKAEFTAIKNELTKRGYKSVKRDGTLIK